MASKVIFKPDPNREPSDPRIGGRDTIEILEGTVMPSEDITAAVVREVMRTQQGLQEEARATTAALNTIAQKVTEISVRIEPVGVLQDRILNQESRLTKVEQAHVDALSQSDRQFRFMLASFGIAGSIAVAILMYLLTHFKQG